MQEEEYFEGTHVRNSLASHSVVYKQQCGKESNVVSPLHLLLSFDVAEGDSKKGEPLGFWDVCVKAHSPK